MTEWKQAERPGAIKMDKFYRSLACPIKRGAGCEHARFFGAVTYQHEETAARVTFLVNAYTSEHAARTAYNVLWDGYYSKAAGLKAMAFDLGPVGERRDALFGAGAGGFGGGPGAVTQTRVGTTLLWTESLSQGKGGIDEDTVRDLAAVLAERAQQAQNGETPSASLDR